MSTPEQRALAGRQLFIKMVLGDAKTAFADTREQLEPMLDADESVAAELPDGTRIGSVKRSKRRQAAAETDPAALLAWVRENRPDMIVETVHPAFVASLKGTCVRLGEAVDVTTGEIVPGIGLVTGNPAYLTQLDPDMIPMLRGKYAELITAGMFGRPPAIGDDPC